MLNILIALLIWLASILQAYTAPVLIIAPSQNADISAAIVNTLQEAGIPSQSGQLSDYDRQIILRANQQPERFTVTSPVAALTLPSHLISSKSPSFTAENLPLPALWLARYLRNECSSLNQTESETLFQGAYLELLQGNCALIDSDLDAAANHYAAARQLVPEYITAAHNLAWVEINRGDQARASILLQEAKTYLTHLKDAPEQIEELQNSSQLYALIFDYEKGLTQINEALSIAAENNAEAGLNAELYRNRAAIYLLLYEWDAALADLNRSLELVPNEAETLFDRGVLYYTMARREDALSDFERYLALDNVGTRREIAQRYIDSIRTELDALNGQ